MRQKSRWFAGLALVVLGLVAPALLSSPAQASVSTNTSSIQKATGAPLGVQKGGKFRVNNDPALASKLRDGSVLSTEATCNQSSYVQVFDPVTGQALITLAPGRTINVGAFTTLLHQGVTLPGTRAIFSYRWNANTAGFDYATSFSEGNCVMRQEPNPLSAQSFPVGTPVSVSVCFVPWELGGQVICGALGTINRTG